MVMKSIKLDSMTRNLNVYRRIFLVINKLKESIYKPSTGFKALICWFLMFFSIGAFAHPHNWITLKTEIFLDEQQRLIKIQQHWEFDIYFSMITMADIMNEYPDPREGLAALSAEYMYNIAEYQYFSVLHVAEKKIELPKPTEHSLTTVQRAGNKILSLSMTFQMEGPISLQNESLELRTYDPSYFIHMSHPEKNNIVVHTQNGESCLRKIVLPNPTDETIDYALSLDRSEKGTAMLGLEFSETVVVNCS
jgi:ABC-type uncharacterized transport system substrate-binding protein